MLNTCFLELWDQRHGRRLTHGVYGAVGGVTGALERRADAVFMDFNEDERDLCRRILLRLTQPGEGTEDARRRVMLRELLPAHGHRAVAVESVIDRLAADKSRLVTILGVGDQCSKKSG